MAWKESITDIYKKRETFYQSSSQPILEYVCEDMWIILDRIDNDDIIEQIWLIYYSLIQKQELKYKKDMKIAKHTQMHENIKKEFVAIFKEKFWI